MRGEVSGISSTRNIILFVAFLDAHVYLGEDSLPLAVVYHLAAGSEPRAMTGTGIFIDSM